MEWFIQLHRKLIEWEWYDDINTKVLFIHLLLKANYKPKSWRGIDISTGEVLTWRIILSEETWLTQQQIRTSLNKLKSTNEITIKTTNRYSIIKLNNYVEYQQVNQQVTQQTTSKQPASNQQVTTTNKDNKDNKEKNISKDITTEVVEDVSYWNKEINNTLSFLQKAVWIDEFKESKKWQRVYGKHFVNYINKQWKEGFIERLKGVLADDFKANNCNSIKYLYNEVKAYRHTPIVQEEKKIKSY